MFAVMVHMYLCVVVCHGSRHDLTLFAGCVGSYSLPSIIWRTMWNMLPRALSTGMAPALPIGLWDGHAKIQSLDQFFEASFVLIPIQRHVLCARRRRCMRSDVMVEEGGDSHLRSSQTFLVVHGFQICALMYRK